MSERLILVCDICGRAASDSVTIKVGRGNFVKDLCETHVSELLRGARRPRRGRRPGIVAKTSASKTTSRTSTGKRRGRPPKARTS